VTVSLPVPGGLAGISLWREFKTDLPLFEHVVKSMPGIYFEEVNLTSTNMPVAVEVRLTGFSYVAPTC
jgi:hypothetical protein